MFYDNFQIAKDTLNQWNFKLFFVVYLVITFTSSELYKFLNLNDKQKILKSLKDTQKETKIILQKYQNIFVRNVILLMFKNLI